MRHLGSIVLSLVLTPIIYALLGIGGGKWSAVIEAGTPRNYVAVGVALGAMVTAGAIYAFLLLVRLSPLGPVLAGLALLGVSMWATLYRGSFTDMIPRDLGGVHGAGWIAGPMTAMLAVPLLTTIVSPRRWRRYADSSGPAASFATPAQAGYGDPYSASPVSSTLSYTSPGYGPPSYPPALSDDPNAFDPEATRRL